MFTGCEADQNGVHIGNDGWLFLSGGSNEALRLLTDENLFVSQDAENWALKLLHRKETLDGFGAQYFHMWVPDKIKVYRQHLNFDPSILKVDPARMVRDSASLTRSGDFIVDPLPALLGRKDEQLLYWKTDTHWTYLGACTAYSVLCEAAEAKALEDLWHHPVQYATLTLDLGSKLVPPVQEKWGGAQVLKYSKVTSKNELMQFLELLNPSLAAPMYRGVAVQFENSRANCDRRRVLLFGDSFSEYRPHLLTGLLAETFQSVMFVWSAAIDYKIVKWFRPDIVVTEMAERFMKTLPDDKLDNEVFALDRITNFLNLRCGNGRRPFTWSQTAEVRE